MGCTGMVLLVTPWAFWLFTIVTIINNPITFLDLFIFFKKIPRITIMKQTYSNFKMAFVTIV